MITADHNLNPFLSILTFHLHLLTCAAINRDEGREHQHLREISNTSHKSRYHISYFLVHFLGIITRKVKANTRALHFLETTEPISLFNINASSFKIAPRWSSSISPAWMTWLPQYVAPILLFFF